MYLKQIEQLVILQKVDDEIIVLEEELENTPKEVAELKSRHQESLEQQNALQEKIDILKNQKARLEQEIENDTLKIKKSKNKLMMVGNSREYHAMMRELDNLEKQNRMREEELAALKEELVRQKDEHEAMQARVGELEEELKVKQANLSELMDKAKKRLTYLQKKRKTASKAIPTPIMGRYEFIRSRLSNPVIVPVEDGICDGCHISIPPQSYIELQKGQQILSCPNCQRLIYWSKHFNGETEQEEQKQAQEA